MNTSMRIGLLEWGLLSSLLPACDPVEPSGTQGALKATGFIYCDGNEGSCDGKTTIPDRLAVRSTFTIQLSSNTGEFGFFGGGLVASSSDTTRLEAIATNDDGSVAFRALSSGAVQVELRGSSKELIDFVRLDLDDVATLALRVCPRAFNAVTKQGAFFDASQCGGEAKGNSSVEISQGSSLAPTVCAVPINAASEDLEGRLTFDWSIAADATGQLEMFVSEDARCATLGGFREGSASVTVASDTKSNTLEVQVVP